MIPWSYPATTPIPDRQDPTVSKLVDATQELLVDSHFIARGLNGIAFHFKGGTGVSLEKARSHPRLQRPDAQEFISQFDELSQDTVDDFNRAHLRLKALCGVTKNDCPTEFGLFNRMIGDLIVCRESLLPDTQFARVFDAGIKKCMEIVSEGQRPSLSLNHSLKIEELRDQIRKGNTAEFRDRFYDRLEDEWRLTGHIPNHDSDADAFLDKIFKFKTRTPTNLDYHREMIQYVPTGAREFANAFVNLNLGENDVFMDVGSGKGRLLVLSTMLAPVRAVGVEYQDDLVDQCQSVIDDFSLHNRISLICDDIRNVDLTQANVFYLYDPFTNGRIMNEVMDQFRDLQRHRPITILALGEIGDRFQRQRWIQSSPLNNPDEIQVFRAGF